MKKQLQNILLSWHGRTVRDLDLAPLLPCSEEARHNLMKRAVQDGMVTRLVKGVYLIMEPYGKMPLNRFEIAQVLKGPSYVSFESALSYHQLIPEAVYVAACATVHRTREIHTPIGSFLFQHLPVKNFFLGVERVADDSCIYFMATPWRALADHYFVFRRPWAGLHSIFEDLRIEPEDLSKFSQESLKNLMVGYPSPRVRKLMKQCLHDWEKQNGQ